MGIHFIQIQKCSESLIISRVVHFKHKIAMVINIFTTFINKLSVFLPKNLHKPLFLLYLLGLLEAINYLTNKLNLKL
ncbi:MAG: hypothetical protein ACI89R_000507 [Candidatus Azotimanducaceae bacterium]|jgi:hypothetical protein